jgi:hypothetical protein
MPDWRGLVSSRLGRTSLSMEEHEAVVAELADHLEEIYEAMLIEGMTEGQAVERALLQFGNTSQLSSRIHAAKHQEGEMNQRTRSFWVPGLVTLTISTSWLLLLQSGHWPMSRPLVYTCPPLAPFAIWLVTLPLIGALGTYLSQRAGGSLRARLGAAAFPSIAFLGLLVFVWVFALFAEKNPFVWQQQAQFVLVFLPWVVFPGIALLAGALLFQRVLQGRLTAS